MSTTTALVVAPHADDESIGCGGTVRALVERGVRVEVLLVTRPDPLDRRPLEHEQALQTLGAHAGPRLDYPQQRFVADGEAVRRVVEALLRLRPALVLAPHRLELDRDHREVHRLVHAALRAYRWLDTAPPPSVWEYEVWTAITYPHVLVDITALAERKREAIACYPSQLEEHDYAAAALGLNAYRGGMLGRGRGLCEAFAQPAAPVLPHVLEDLCTRLE